MHINNDWSLSKGPFMYVHPLASEIEGHLIFSYEIRGSLIFSSNKRGSYFFPTKNGHHFLFETMGGRPKQDMSIYDNHFYF